MVKWNKWKIKECGIIHSGETILNKKDFEKMLDKGTKLIEFTEGGE